MTYGFSNIFLDEIQDDTSQHPNPTKISIISSSFSCGICILNCFDSHIPHQDFDVGSLPCPPQLREFCGLLVKPSISLRQDDFSHRYPGSCSMATTEDQHGSSIRLGNRSEHKRYIT